MAKLYGLPYLGSKSGLCNRLVKLFPKAENFYDLFGGGFSVTHAMIEKRSKDFKQFHFNEIRKGMTDLIKDSVAGKYSYENFKPPFVSREEFFEKKESDLYIKLVWSFGNNGKTYLFGKNIEAYKKSLHQAIVFNEFDDTAKMVLGMDKFKTDDIKSRRLFLGNRIKVLGQYKNDAERQQLQQLERLERLEQLERLQQLERLGGKISKLNFYNLSYDKVPIKQNSVIYCDPPYKNTAKYDGDFDHDKFLAWAAKSPHPVFISEYSLHDSRFVRVACFYKLQTLSAKKNSLVTESLYANRAAWDRMQNG